MTVEEKVGQLLVPVMAGTSADAVTAGQAANNQRLGGQDTMAALVATYHLGGVIYLGPNVVDASQLTDLSAGLQAANAESNVHGIGLFVSVDQEGGRVARISDGVTPIPAARDFTPDDRAVRSSSFISAQELRRQGFNVVFAPVADLVPAEGPEANRGVIGNRSYSGDPDEAAVMVRAAVQGLQSGGVAAVVKHWPGHGATSIDSHRSLPTVEVDRATWNERELVPFLAAMDADVDMVMVGHLSLPGLDPSGTVSSISPVIVQQILRDELGYDGVVVTDALDMGAVSDVAQGELAVRSVEAGVDVLLAMPDIAAAHGSIVEAVATGRISEERLDESVRRILELKAELRLLS